MKKTLLFILLAACAATTVNAQYFQYLYGTTSTTERLSCGHNAYQGGNTGHFLVGPTDIHTTSIDILAQRTDINGSATPAGYFNNVYRLTDQASNRLNIREPKSIEFSNGNGFGIAASYRKASGSAPLIGVVYLPLSPTGTAGAPVGYFPTAAAGTYSAIVVTGMTESIQNNNEMYILGYVRMATSGLTHPFIIKIDQAGMIIWANVYDLNGSSSTNTEIPYDIIESPNGLASGVVEVVVVGEYRSSSTANSDGVAFRVDQLNGNISSVVWLYTIRPTSDDVLTSIVASGSTIVDPGGAGYVMAGYSDELGSNDYWALGIDQAGSSIAWSTLIDYNNAGPTSNDDRCLDLIERFNTSSQYEYYLQGYTDNGFYGMEDVVVMKLDQNGTGVANGQFTYGDTQNDRGIRIDQLNGFGTNVDGLGIYNWSDNNSGFSIGGIDHFLVKAYFNGVTCTPYDLQNTLDAAWATSLLDSRAIIIDQLSDFPLNVNRTNATENNICSAASIAAGSNALQRPAAQKIPGVKDAISVFPNPAGGASLVEVKLAPGKATQVEVQVTDMLGRVYYNTTVQAGNGTAHVQLPGLKEGTYFITAKTTESRYKTILMVR